MYEQETQVLSEDFWSRFFFIFGPWKFESSFYYLTGNMLLSDDEIILFKMLQY